MAWTYRQRTGELVRFGGVAGKAYSGHGEGKNDPTKQDQHDIGPIPRGKYTMLQPMDTPTHGPYVITLRPDPANEMHGRSGFLCHGDSVAHPGDASHGCIVTSHSMRQCLWQSGDHEITVVEG